MNSELVKHIEKLLYETDCVIIPGFGAFVAQRRPAAINPIAGRIEPRSRFIAFNPALKHNDGTLISAIAEGENLSYPEAQNLLDTWVNEAWKALREERTLQLGGSGSFIMGPEAQLIFQPKQNRNYDVDSYGLQAVPLLLIHSDAEEMPVEEVEVMPAETASPEAIITVAKPKKKTAWAAMGVLTCLLAAGVIIGKNTFFDNTQFSSLNPLNFDSNVIDRMVEEADKHASQQATDSMLTDELEKPVIDTKQWSDADSVYFIVGGAFAIQNNAFKLSSLLEAKGYQPEIIKQDGYRLIRVTYNTSYDRATADSFLNEIRNRENPEGWLLALARKDYNTIQK